PAAADHARADADREGRHADGEGRQHAEGHRAEGHAPEADAAEADGSGRDDHDEDDSEEGSGGGQERCRRRGAAEAEVRPVRFDAQLRLEVEYRPCDGPRSWWRLHSCAPRMPTMPPTPRPTLCS